MPYISEPLLKLKPQMIIYVLIAMLLFVPQIYADSYMVLHVDEYVPHSENDIFFNIEYYENLPTTKTYAETKLEEKLSSEKMILSYYDYIRFYGGKISKNGTDDSNIYWSPMVFVLENDTLYKIGYNVTNGSFNSSGVVISESIAKILQLAIGDTIKMNYTYWISDRLTRSILIYFNVTGIASTNQTISYFAEIDIAMLPKFFENIMLPKLKIITDYVYLDYSHVYVADIDDSIVDPVNPEFTVQTISSFIDSIQREIDYSHGYYISIYSPLLYNLYNYIDARTNLRNSLLYVELPIIIIFFVLSVYIMNFLLTKWKKTLLVMVARGWALDIGTSQVMREIFKSFLVGSIIGFVLSFPISRLYLIFVPLSTGESIQFNQFITFPMVIATMSSIPTLIYLAFIFIGGLFANGIIHYYKSMQKKIEKREGGILKRIYTHMGEASFYIMMLLFGFLMISQSYTFGISEMARYFVIFQLLYLLAPYLFVFALLYFFYRTFGAYMLKRISAYVNRRRNYRLFLALKNMLRRDTSLAVITLVFVFMISVNVLTTSVAIEYKPYTLAKYRWVYGGDLILNFMAYSNTTDLEPFIENISSIDGIVDYTSIYIYNQKISDIYINVYAIDPTTFVKCVYDENGMPLENSDYGKVFAKIAESTKGAVISEYISSYLGVYENDTLAFFDYSLKKLDYYDVVGVTDFTLPGIWVRYYWYYEPYPSIIPVYGGYGYDDYWLTYREDMFIVVNKEVIRNVTMYFDVVVSYKIKENANITQIESQLSNNLKQTPLYNTTYPSYVYVRLIRSAISDYESIIESPGYKHMLASFGLNLTYSFVYLLIAMWVYAAILEIRRKREFGVLLALGLKKRDLLLSLLYESIIIFLISLPFGFLTVYTATPIFAFIVNMPISYLLHFYTTTQFVYLIGSVLFTAFLAVIAFGVYIVIKGTKMEVTKLLKFEWTGEELERELGVNL